MSIEIGKKVRAARDLPYLGGQAPEDKIDQGELLTVERVEGNQLYFEEHADRYGGWPESEFIPDGMYLCPNCENPVSEVYAARSVKLEWDGQTWLETDVYSQGMSCPICLEDIDDSTLETFGLRSPASGTGKIVVGQSYGGEDLLKLVGVDPDAFQQARERIAVVGEGKVVVAVDVGNDNWEVTHVFPDDKAFYSLNEDDILEVANALGEELTPDEVTRAKSAVDDGMGSHWWDVTEDVIQNIVNERRESDGSSESSD